MNSANSIRPRAIEGLSELRTDQKANLVHLSAAYDEKADEVLWQLVVLDGVDDDELEEYSCIATEVIADFQTATMREVLIRLDKAEDVKQVGALPIMIYNAEA